MAEANELVVTRAAAKLFNVRYKDKGAAFRLDQIRDQSSWLLKRMGEIANFFMQDTSYQSTWKNASKVKKHILTEIREIRFKEIEHGSVNGDPKNGDCTEC